MPPSRRTVLAAGLGLVATQATGRAQGHAATDPIPATVPVPAGPFIRGSDAEEREFAYRLDEGAYGHSRTRDRGWYDHEIQRERIDIPAFRICRTPITNRQYATFVRDTAHRIPDVEPSVWAGYGLIHPYERTRRHAWTKGGFPVGRADHPVVLVSHGDAVAYAAWLSAQTGEIWSLPSEDQWEKAARGTDGRYFPWGNRFDPARLNSHDAGPYDTVPVGSFPLGDSPYGAGDMAGQVFEWTGTPQAPDRHIVKGGSWDDRGCGVCRAAARHSRPNALKHILIGFRLVLPSVG
ncbi:MAG: SUMF1/EgtB/PvdO family nonheme iron enzyme [Alphaproteobacteria bacterium]